MSENVEFLLSARNMTGEAFASVEKSLKGIGESILSVQGLMLSLAGSAIGALVKSAANLENEMGKLAQRAGVSVEAISGLRYAADLSDVSIESLGTGLKHLSMAMVDTQAGTGEAQAAFRALGLSVTDASGALKPTQLQLFDIADKFAGMQDGAGKTALAMRIFGRAGNDLIPLLNHGSEGLRQNADEARRFGLIVSTEAAREAEAFNDNLTRLKSAAEGLKIELAGPLIKALRGVTDEMLEGQRIAGSFGQALLLFGTINPFRSIGGNLNELRKDLDAAESGLQKRLERGWDPKPFEEKIGDLKAQIKFLEYQQRTALDLARTDTLDARDYQARAGAGTKAPAPALPNMDASAGDWLAKQLEAGRQEENRVMAEAWAATSAYRDQQLAGEKAFQDTRLQQMLEFIDAKQNAEIAAGQALIDADGVSHSTRLQNFQQQFLSEADQENIAYQLKLVQLAQFSDAELKVLGGYAGAKEQLEQQHMERVRNIRVSGENDVQRLVRLARAGDVQGALGTFTAITAGLATHNKQMFELNKASGITQAVISAYVGISKTLETYAFPLSAVMAAAQGAIAFAQVSAIQGLSFGGGQGAAPSISAGAPAAPVLPVDRQGQSASGQAGGSVTIIHLPAGFDKAQLYSGESMFALLKALEEATRGGGRVVIE